MNGESKDITELLNNIQTGSFSSDDLLPVVYDELRKLAASRMASEDRAQTLQPTALVHEAYLRLIGCSELRWESRGHFFSAAARSMRQILINRALQRKTAKHGGGLIRHESVEEICKFEPEPEWLLALDDALSRLENIDSRKGKVVSLRYFAGLSIEETAKVMELSPATIKREWRFARAWLQRELSDAW